MIDRQLILIWPKIRYNKKKLSEGIPQYGVTRSGLVCYPEETRTYPKSNEVDGSIVRSGPKWPEVALSSSELPEMQCRLKRGHRAEALDFVTFLIIGTNHSVQIFSNGVKNFTSYFPHNSFSEFLSSSSPEPLLSVPS